VNSVGGLSFPDGRIFGTAQFEKEWKIYRDILNRTNVTKYTKWLDIRGNHGKEIHFQIKYFQFFSSIDVFMDSNPDSLNNFYR